MFLGRKWFPTLLAAMLAAQLGSTAGNGFLQWDFSEPMAAYPFEAALPPALVPLPNNRELVLSFVNRTGAQWNVAAKDPSTGATEWEASVTGSAAAGLVNGVQTQQAGNSLALAAALLDGRVVALDPATGAQLWQALPPGDAQFRQVSGWNGVAYLLTGQQPVGAGPPPKPGTTSSAVVALDAASGARLWASNNSELLAAAGGDGLGAFSPVVETLTAAPGLAIYSAGNKILGLSLANGSAAWTLAVGVDAGGAGAAANITDVQYLQRQGGGVLLVTSINWGYQRFAAYVLSAAGGAPVLSWQSARADAEQAFRDALARPALWALPKSAAFAYWANRTVWSTAGPAVRHTLVARSVDTGREVWEAAHPDPVAAPTVRDGRVFAVAADGLLVLDATSGGGQWGVAGAAAAAGPGPGAGGASYDPAVSFGELLGQVVVMRCLGRADPANLCSYAGYEFAADPQNAALAARGPLPPLAAALLALAALLLLH